MAGRFSSKFAWSMSCANARTKQALGRVIVCKIVCMAQEREMQAWCQ